MADCINALKEWTGKARASVVYDSTVDEFTAGGLFQKVKGNKNIAVVGFTTDGDVFGMFYSRAVTKQDVRFFDPTVFVFSFESHGRCKTPQRFVLKEGLKRDACVAFWKNDSSGFVVLWVGHECGFYLGNERSYSDCWDMSRAFDRLEDTALTGKSGHRVEGRLHHCARLLAVLLE